jgi:hypothetical protein
MLLKCGQIKLADMLQMYAAASTAINQITHFFQFAHRKALQGL